MMEADRCLKLASPEGVEFRDLNSNGGMDPFEDPRLTYQDRVEDLVGRLSLPRRPA